MQDAVHKLRTKGLGVLIAFFLIVSTLGVIATTIVHTQSARASAAGGTGATLPYVELEAHSANTNGTILGPDFTLGSLASDAVDRQAVQLTQGQYVEFTLPQAANSINLRYSIPDAAGGGGLNASLSIYINGVKQSSSLQLTSKYSWVYGAPDFSNCNGNVWSNSPGGTAHHQFDEVHTRLPEMGANTKVRLQVDSENTAAWYAIDVADFQEVPAELSKPSGYISITDSPYNADPTGAVDATQAIQNAVNAGSSQGKGVWIPTGKFLVTSHILVNNVTLTGAGPWYAVLGGAPTSSTGTGVGVYGYDVYDGSSSSNVTLSNFTIEGQITNRVDCIQDNGIGGSLNNSTISNIWIEHTKVGMWFDGPFSGLTVTGCRIDSVFADGLNFHRAVSNSSVRQSIIRGTGDDGLAMWSDLNGASIGDTNDTFDHNTVQLPFVANGIAIYGGAGNTVTNNIVSGSQYRGGGINLDYQNFGSSTAPFSGTTTVSYNTIKQVAGWGDQGIQQFGALMFWSASGGISAPFTVDQVEIDNTLFAAISFDGGNSIGNIALSNVNISGAQFAFSNKVSTITGSATNVTASGLTVGSLQSCEGSGSWNITMGSGNSGWSAASQTCGFPPPGTTPTPGATPTPLPPGIRIKSQSLGTYLYEANGRVMYGNPASSDTTSQWILESFNGNTRIRNVATGHYMAIEHLTGYVEAIAIYDSWQSPQWTIQSGNTSGYNIIRNVWQNTSVINVVNQLGYAEYGPLPSNQASAQWAFENVSSGTTPTPGVTPTPTNTPTPGVTPTPTRTPTPTPTATPPTGTLLRALNAGGGATGSFVADTGYNQGNAFSDTSTSIDTSGVSNAAPQAVYQTCRWNSSFTYTLSGLTAGTTYTLRLDWAELTWQAAGQRIFNVAINGSTVLSNFDVFAAAGGYKKALARQFTVAANGSGQIVIAFTQGGVDNPFISGLELYGSAGTVTPTPTPTLVKAINAGGSASGSFVADSGYNQGNSYSDTSSSINTGAVNSPASQAVWQTCRWYSSFTYTLTGLTAGATYTLRLDWAELTWQATGQRKFNVAINGSTVLSAFDVFAAGGYKTAVQRQFTVTANSSGQIVIAFTQGGADNPFISAIELYQG